MKSKYQVFYFTIWTQENDFENSDYRHNDVITTTVDSDVSLAEEDIQDFANTPEGDDYVYTTPEDDNDITSSLALIENIRLAHVWFFICCC